MGAETRWRRVEGNEKVRASTIIFKTVGHVTVSCPTCAATLAVTAALNATNWFDAAVVSSPRGSVHGVSAAYVYGRIGFACPLSWYSCVHGVMHFLVSRGKLSCVAASIYTRPSALDMKRAAKLTVSPMPT